MNDSRRIVARIERGTSTGLDDGLLLQAAARALTEAQANLKDSGLQVPQTLTQEEVFALSNKLVSEAWGAQELPGEAPIDPLHHESSGWEGSDPDAERIPWLIFVADVLDCTALLMGANDLLVLEVQA